MNWTKRDLRAMFPNDSDQLFNACYRELNTWIRQGAIDTPDLQDAANWIEQLMAERVNDSRSPFYLYG